eukprot:COSAG01_NODE_231_length_21019_cov_104.980501_19_plen_40_part_00
MILKGAQVRINVTIKMQESKHQEDNDVMLLYLNHFTPTL